MAYKIHLALPAWRGALVYVMASVIILWASNLAGNVRSWNMFPVSKLNPIIPLEHENLLTPLRLLRQLSQFKRLRHYWMYNCVHR